MEKVRIGQITAPFGIRGEFRVFPYTDRETRFSDIKNIYVGEGTDKYTIERARYDKGMVILKLKEVSDRNTSELLRGKNLYVDRDLYVLDDDSYFVDDLLGCSVFSDEGENLGTMVNVIQNSSQDIYEIKKADGKNFLVPAVKEFIKEVDIENKKIVIHVIDGLLA